MRIAFFGLPIAACLLARDGHELVFAALSFRGALGARRLQRSMRRGTVCVAPKIDQHFVESRAQERPDLLVSWFWPKKLPEELLHVARFGAVGVHPSLLPRHRGPDPYFWAIDSGDTITGVTAHRLLAEYDTGAMLGQIELPIGARWNSWTLARKLDRPSLALLRNVVRSFADGCPPAEIAQDEALASLAPQPTDAELELNWKWPTVQLLRRIRAAAPSPGAHFWLDTVTGGADVMVTVLEATPCERPPLALLPGESAVVDGTPVIRTGDGAISLRRVRVDDSENELSGHDLVQLLGPR